jgi:hypothetical protein
MIRWTKEMSAPPDRPAKLSRALDLIKSGLSQAKAARLAGLSPATLCRHLATIQKGNTKA